jgi:hypothetical protein
MKCMPITLPGLLVQLAIFVMDIDEVLEASTTSFLVTLSNSWNTVLLTSGFSTTACISPPNYLHNKVHIPQIRNLLLKANPILDVLPLLFRKSLLALLLTNPVIDELLRFLQSSSIINKGDVEAGDAAGDNADAGAHLAGADDAEVFYLGEVSEEGESGQHI